MYRTLGKVEIANNVHLNCYKTDTMWWIALIVNDAQVWDIYAFSEEMYKDQLFAFQSKKGRKHIMSVVKTKLAYEEKLNQLKHFMSESKGA